MTAPRHDGPPHAALPLIGAIAGMIRWVEELISLLSGPLLSVGLAIALIDLLTGGGLLRSIPELLYAWGVCQAVGIDAQLVATWDRARTAARRGAWWSVVGLVILGVALGYVGFLSAQAFGFQQAFGLSEVEALQRLGIDAASWQFQRAILAVFLVALSGWTRYHPPAKAKPNAEVERAELERELELEPLRQRLRAQKAVGGVALARQAFSAATGHTPAGVPVVSAEGLAGHPDKPPTGPGSPSAVPVRTPGASPKPLRLVEKVEGTPQRRRATTAGRANTPAAKAGAKGVRTPRDSEAAERAARAAWAPGMSVGELQAAAGISRNAASKHRRILMAESASEGQQAAL